MTLGGRELLTSPSLSPHLHPAYQRTCKLEREGCLTTEHPLLGELFLPTAEEPRPPLQIPISSGQAFPSGSASEEEAGKKPAEFCALGSWKCYFCLF